MRPTSLFAVLLACGLALTAGCSGVDTSGSKIYEQGLREAEAGNVDAAITTLKKGASSYPNNPRIRLELARLQLEKGQGHHLQEREQMRAYATKVEAGEGEGARTHVQAANVARRKATPWYQAARESLEAVIDLEDEPERLAWASLLAMRVEVFFEDYAAAYDHLSRAINKGRPSGRQLAAWRDYQAALKDKAGPDRD